MFDGPIIDEILAELKRAKKKHPSWPDHIVARAAIVGEESGELIREAVNYKYELPNDPEERKASIDRMRKEAIQTAATSIRFIESLKDLK